MLKWTTRDTLNHLESARRKRDSGGTTTDNPASCTRKQYENTHGSLQWNSEKSTNQTQVQRNTELSNRPVSSRPFTVSKSSVSPRITRQHSMSSADKLSTIQRSTDALPSRRTNVRHGQSWSLPSSPQKFKAAYLDDTQKKSGVLSKVKNLFRMGTSTKKDGRTSQASSPSSAKSSPGRARRSISPADKHDSEHQKKNSTNKSRLTRLIEAKRGDRKLVSLQNSPFYAPRSVPSRPGSNSSLEKHGYIQHSQLDKTLFLQNKSVFGCNTPEGTDCNYTVGTFQDNQAKFHQSTEIYPISLRGYRRLTELGAPFHYPANKTYLKRSPSVRSTTDIHGENFPTVEESKRRWSSQSSNGKFTSTYTPELLPASTPEPCPARETVAKLDNKDRNSDESLFQFGESLMTMLESGSLKKVKVMPSQPNTIIQARKTLSPVPQDMPPNVRETGLTNIKNTIEISDAYSWALTDSGNMIITNKHPRNCDNTEQKSNEILIPTGVSLPRNNNNGHGKVHEIYQKPHTESDSHDVWVRTGKNEVEDVKRGEMKGKSDFEDGVMVVAPKSKSPASVYPETNDINRVRVKDIVKSIEQQSIGVSGEATPNGDQRHQNYDEANDTADDDWDTFGKLDDDSEDEDNIETQSTGVPFGWKTKPETVLNTEEIEISPVSPASKVLEVGSLVESEGFSPKVCSSLSDVKSSFPETLNRSIRENASKETWSIADDQQNESSSNTDACAASSSHVSSAQSISTDSEHNTFSFQSDLQGIASENSNLDSLVRKITTPDITKEQTQKQGSTTTTGEKALKKIMEATATDKQLANSEQDLCSVFQDTLTDRRFYDYESYSMTLSSVDNTEYGIMEAEAPVSEILQSRSILDEIPDYSVELLDENLSEFNYKPNQKNEQKTGTSLGQDYIKHISTLKRSTAVSVPLQSQNLQTELIESSILHLQCNQENVKPNISQQDSHKTLQQASLQLGHDEPLLSTDEHPETTMSIKLAGSPAGSDVQFKSRQVIGGLNSTQSPEKDAQKTKPKKKVSFSFDVFSPESLSSVSEMAVIELTQVNKFTGGGAQKSKEDLQNTLLPADDASSTDVSSCFSLISNDTHESQHPAASTNADILNWRETEAVDDAESFHGQINEHNKGTEAKSNFDAEAQTSEVNLPTQDSIKTDPNKCTFSKSFEDQKTDHVAEINPGKSTYLTCKRTETFASVQQKEVAVVIKVLNLPCWSPTTQDDSKNSLSDTESHTYVVNYAPPNPQKHKIPWWKKSAVSANDSNHEFLEADCEGSSTPSDIVNKHFHSDCSLADDILEAWSRDHNEGKQSSGMSKGPCVKIKKRKKDITSTRQGSKTSPPNSPNTLQPKQGSLQVKGGKRSRKRRAQFSKLASAKKIKSPTSYEDTNFPDGKTLVTAHRKKRESFLKKRKRFLLDKFRNEKTIAGTNKQVKHKIHTNRGQVKKAPCVDNSTNDTPKGVSVNRKEVAMNTARTRAINLDKNKKRGSSGSLSPTGVNPESTHYNPRKAKLSTLTKCRNMSTAADDRSGPGDCWESSEEISFQTASSFLKPEYFRKDLHKAMDYTGTCSQHVQLYPSEINTYVNMPGYQSEYGIHDARRLQCKHSQFYSDSADRCAFCQFSSDDSVDALNSPVSTHQRKRRFQYGHTNNIKPCSLEKPCRCRSEAHPLAGHQRRDSFRTDRECPPSPRKQFFCHHPSSCSSCPQQHCQFSDTSHSQCSNDASSTSSVVRKSRLDSQPGQWLFIATFFVFQLFLHWLYAR